MNDKKEKKTIVFYGRNKMLNTGKLSDAQYDLLIGCFKCKVPRKAICLISGLSYDRVCSEWHRWDLCKKITSMVPPPRKPRWNEVHLSNSSKVFSY